MSDELLPLDRELARLAAAAGPAERRKLGRSIAADLRTANAKRIRANVTPEGTAMEPRKASRPTALVSAAKRPKSLRPPRMFTKAPGSLVRSADADMAELGFSGTADRIMSVHQFGLVDRVSRDRGAPEVAYPERTLLGLSDEDRERILAKMTAQLAG